jgi:2-polyprenyl-6-methoxyphenol hydroxylase-like FAD-dependent oxidoreductase
MTEDFDVVVTGGGPAGISGANTAGIFGKRVALVERLHDVGGAGINTGTIPSKTLRETALALSGMRSRKLFGVELSLRREATHQGFHEAQGFAFALPCAGVRAPRHYRHHFRTGSSISRRSCFAPPIPISSSMIT